MIKQRARGILKILKGYGKHLEWDKNRKYLTNEELAVFEEEIKVLGYLTATKQRNPDDFVLNVFLDRKAILKIVFNTYNDDETYIFEQAVLKEVLA